MCEQGDSAKREVLSQEATNQKLFLAAKSNQSLLNMPRPLQQLLRWVGCSNYEAVGS